MSSFRHLCRYAHWNIIYLYADNLRILEILSGPGQCHVVRGWISISGILINTLSLSSWTNSLIGAGFERLAFQLSHRMVAIGFDDTIDCIIDLTH